MSPKHIEAQRATRGKKYDLAIRIRTLLDEARKAYGPTEWEAHDVETEILELVTADDPV